jgi:hypothetical protein
MSTTSDKSAGRMRKNIAIVVHCFVTACAATTTDTSLFRRTWIVGTQDDLVHDPDARRGIQPNSYVIDAKDVVMIDKRVPPPACGDLLVAQYLDGAREIMAAVAAHCSIQKDRVYCDTQYIDGYDHTYVRLRYGHVDQHLMKLDMEVLQRASDGSSHPGLSLLRQEHRLELQRLFQRLMVTSECNH